MSYIKNVLQKELKAVEREITMTDERIDYINNELDSAKERKIELTNAREQLKASIDSDKDTSQKIINTTIHLGACTSKSANEIAEQLVELSNNVKSW